MGFTNFTDAGNEIIRANPNDPYAEVNRRLALRNQDPYYAGAGTAKGPTSTVDQRTVPELAPYVNGPKPDLNYTGYVPEYMRARAENRNIALPVSGGNASGSTGGTGGGSNGGNGGNGGGGGSGGSGGSGAIEQSTGLMSAARTPAQQAAAYQAAQLNNPTPWNVTQNQTVSGQIQSIINQDSPLMEMARTRALQTMNKKGLMNSSMAVQAGQAAVYDAALPIAQADASTYGRAAAWNADQRNVFARDNVNAQNQAMQFNTGAQNDVNRDVLQINAQKEAAFTKSYNDMIAMTKGFENDVEMAKLKQNLTMRGVGQEQRIASVQNLITTINNIQNNPNLSAETKKEYIRAAINATNAGIDVIMNASGITGDLLDFPDLDENGNGGSGGGSGGNGGNGGGGSGGNGGNGGGGSGGSGGSGTGTGAYTPPPGSGPYWAQWPN